MAVLAAVSARGVSLRKQLSHQRQSTRVQIDGSVGASINKLLKVMSTIENGSEPFNLDLWLCRWCLICSDCHARIPGEIIREIFCRR